MLVLGIDPGVTTGIVWFNEWSQAVELADDITSPIHLYELLRRFHDDNDRGFFKTVVLEQYVGAGPRTNEALHTIKLVGFVEHLCAAWNLSLVMQTPQQRKPLLARASAMLPNGPHHAKDALGHILAFLGLNPIMPVTDTHLLGETTNARQEIAHATGTQRGNQTTHDSVDGEAISGVEGQG